MEVIYPCCIPIANGQIPTHDSLTNTHSLPIKNPLGNRSPFTHLFTSSGNIWVKGEYMGEIFQKTPMILEIPLHRSKIHILYMDPKVILNPINLY